MGGQYYKNKYYIKQTISVCGVRTPFAYVGPPLTAPTVDEGGQSAAGSVEFSPDSPLPSLGLATGEV